MSAEGISSQVRRIAILVTSLDASAGRQLLMAMPADLARQVRRAMTQLGAIDPDEQRQILAEFRSQALADEAQPKTNQSARAATISNDFSPASSHNTHESSAQRDDYASRGLAGGVTGGVTGGVGSSPGSTPYGSGLDVNTLSELLRGERATVVAVVISQLEPQRGADLLGKLPKALQREAIVSLSRLGQIDPDAMAAIDEHLASRIADYHHRQAGQSESTGRMQELLAAAAPDLRSDWQSTLYQAEPHLAQRLGIAAPAPLQSQAVVPAQAAPPRNAVGVTAKHAASVGAVREVDTVVEKKTTRSGELREAGPAPAGSGTNLLEMLANNVVTTADQQTLTALAQAEDDRARILPFPTRPAKPSKAATMRFEQILDLPADEIGGILAAADTEVILYALAGASPAFMKRFMAMLDRADGRALEARLRQLRAINLKDVDAAQQRLCELASSRRMASAA